jgi:hypothetical protein
MGRGKTLSVAVAFFLVAAHATQPNTQISPRAQVLNSSDARAKFIKKCFRNRTKESCEAPLEARADTSIKH